MIWAILHVNNASAEANSFSRLGIDCKLINIHHGVHYDRRRPTAVFLLRHETTVRYMVAAKELQSLQGLQLISVTDYFY